MVDLSFQRMVASEDLNKLTQVIKKNMLKERKTSLKICIARPQALRKLHQQKLETATESN
jgi:hypothetical protein